MCCLDAGTCGASLCSEIVSSCLHSMQAHENWSYIVVWGAQQLYCLSC